MFEAEACLLSVPVAFRDRRRAASRTDKPACPPKGPLAELVMKDGSRSSTDPPHATRYEDAVRHFLGACPEWDSLLQAWRADSRYRPEVVPFVESFKATVLYTLTPEDVQSVCRKTEHALGTVKRQAGEAVRQAVDWNPAFALEHALHSAAEDLKRLP